MNIKARSHFKDEAADFAWFESWVERLEGMNERRYERFEVQTALGRTHVWGLNTTQDHPETLLIFPGARTTALIWDFDRGLDLLNHPMRIFMVETNGLPNLSEGNTPDIKSLDYGHWAAEVMDGLNLDRAYIAGASFGGLICMKLGITHPERVKAAFLLNPGCLQPFSMRLKNLYYNLLPIIRPTERNVSKFLEKAVFSKPNHELSMFADDLLVDYEVFALKRYKDKTQKPYYMNQQLAEVKVDTYLLLGDRDLLFPYRKSAENAKKHLRALKETKVFPEVGHGIETYGKAINYVGVRIRSLAEDVAGSTQAGDKLTFKFRPSFIPSSDFEFHLHPDHPTATFTILEYNREVLNYDPYLDLGPHSIQLGKDIFEKFMLVIGTVDFENYLDKDKRFLCDGISVELDWEGNMGELYRIMFRSPSRADFMLEYQLLDSFFELIEKAVESYDLVEYLEQLKGYFDYGFPVRQTGDNPLEYRIWGALTSSEEKDLQQFFASLPEDEPVIFDCRNFSLMGGMFIDSFRNLNAEKKIYYLAKGSVENGPLNWIGNCRMFESREALMRAIEEDKK